MVLKRKRFHHMQTTLNLAKSSVNSNTVFPIYKCKQLCFMVWERQGIIAQECYISFTHHKNHEITCNMDVIIIFNNIFDTELAFKTPIQSSSSHLRWIGHKLVEDKFLCCCRGYYCIQVFMQTSLQVQKSTHLEGLCDCVKKRIIKIHF